MHHCFKATGSEVGNFTFPEGWWMVGLTVIVMLLSQFGLGKVGRHTYSQRDQVELSINHRLQLFEIRNPDINNSTFLGIILQYFK